MKWVYILLAIFIFFICPVGASLKRKRLNYICSNNQPGAQALALSIQNFILEQQNYKDALSIVVVALESTSYYGIYIANYLSSCRELLPFKTFQGRGACVAFTLDGT